MKVKKFLSILLTICIVFSLVPAARAEAAGITEVSSNLQEAINNAGFGDTLKLAADITENVTIASDKAIILDLNGFVLKSCIKYGEGADSVIINKGSLTIVDSNPDKEHYFIYNEPPTPWGFITTPLDEDKQAAKTIDKINDDTKVVKLLGGCITGGTALTPSRDYEDQRASDIVGYNGAGGGIYSTGKLVLNGGNICGNDATAGGGVFCWDGAFAMNGGMICGNFAQYGGGVCLYDNSFAMTDGSICHNIGIQTPGLCEYPLTNNDYEMGSKEYKNNENRKITMTGGSICSNALFVASRGTAAVCLVYGAEFGGEMIIADNQNNGVQNNVSILNGYIKLNNLKGKASIGINQINGKIPGRFTTGTAIADDAKYFFSDHEDYFVRYDGYTVNDEYLELASPVCQIERTQTKYGTVNEALAVSETDDTIKLISDNKENITIDSGKSVTLDLNGKTLSSSVKGKDTVITNNGELTLTNGSITGGGTGVKQNGTLTLGGILNISGSKENLY